MNKGETPEKKLTRLKSEIEAMQVLLRGYQNRLDEAEKIGRPDKKQFKIEEAVKYVEGKIFESQNEIQKLKGENKNESEAPPERGTNSPSNRNSHF